VPFGGDDVVGEQRGPSANTGEEAVVEFVQFPTVDLVLKISECYKDGLGVLPSILLIY
jgi:hypothetical protein